MTDTTFADLLSLITTYLDELERFPRRERKLFVEIELKDYVCRELPDLAKAWDNELPPPIYVAEVITFAIAGLDDEVASSCWKIQN